MPPETAQSLELAGNWVVIVGSALFALACASYWKKPGFDTADAPVPPAVIFTALITYAGLLMSGGTFHLFG